MLKLRTTAILALSLSLAPASAREFHSGHARGFNGHATTSTDMQQEASIAAEGMVAVVVDIADMAVWRILGQQRNMDTTRSRTAILGGAAIAAAPYYDAVAQPDTTSLAMAYVTQRTDP